MSEVATPGAACRATRDRRPAPRRHPSHGQPCGRPVRERADPTRPARTRLRPGARPVGRVADGPGRGRATTCLKFQVRIRFASGPAGDVAGPALERSSVLALVVLWFAALVAALVWVGRGLAPAVAGGPAPRRRAHGGLWRRAGARADGRTGARAGTRGHALGGGGRRPGARGVAGTARGAGRARPRRGRARRVEHVPHRAARARAPTRSSARRCSPRPTTTRYGLGLSQTLERPGVRRARRERGRRALRRGRGRGPCPPLRRRRSAVREAFAEAAVRAGDASGSPARPSPRPTRSSPWRGSGTGSAT